MISLPIKSIEENIQAAKNISNQGLRTKMRIRFTNITSGHIVHHKSVIRITQRQIIRSAQRCSTKLLKTEPTNTPRSQWYCNRPRRPRHWYLGWSGLWSGRCECGEGSRQRKRGSMAVRVETGQWRMLTFPVVFASIERNNAASGTQLSHEGREEHLNNKGMRAAS